MIIYLSGPDTFRSRQYLKEQVEKLKIAHYYDGYEKILEDILANI